MPMSVPFKASSSGAATSRSPSAWMSSSQARRNWQLLPGSVGSRPTVRLIQEGEPGFLFVVAARPCDRVVNESQLLHDRRRVYEGIGVGQAQPAIEIVQ